MFLFIVGAIVSLVVITFIMDKFSRFLRKKVWIKFIGKHDYKYKNQGEFTLNGISLLENYKKYIIPNYVEGKIEIKNENYDFQIFDIFYHRMKGISFPVVLKSPLTILCIKLPKKFENLVVKNKSSQDSLLLDTVGMRENIKYQLGKKNVKKLNNLKNENNSNILILGTTENQKIPKKLKDFINSQKFYELNLFFELKNNNLSLCFVNQGLSSKEKINKLFEIGEEIIETI